MFSWVGKNNLKKNKNNWIHNQKSNELQKMKIYGYFK